MGYLWRLQGHRIAMTSAKWFKWGLPQASLLSSRDLQIGHGAVLHECTGRGLGEGMLPCNLWNWPAGFLVLDDPNDSGEVAMVDTAQGCLTCLVLGLEMAALCVRVWPRRWRSIQKDPSIRWNWLNPHQNPGGQVRDHRQSRSQPQPSGHFPGG